MFIIVLVMDNNLALDSKQYDRTPHHSNYHCLSPLQKEEKQCLTSDKCIAIRGAIMTVRKMG